MGTKKRIPLRLYRQHDMDLIILLLNKDFGFTKAMKRALHCYGKEPYFFSVPALDEFGINREIKYVYKRELVLDSEREADIIELLDRVKPLYRNEFIKMVMRGSMIGPYAYGCLSGQNENINAENIILDFQEAVMDGKMSDPPKRNDSKGKKIEKDKSNKIKKKNEKKKNAVEPQKKEEIKIQKKQLAKQKETINKEESAMEVVEGGDYSNNDDFFSELNSMLGRNL